MLVKKIQHDTRDLSNYRPISLTNSMYKIFASLIQKRLSDYFDENIRSTQFGMRAKRSTNVGSLRFMKDSRTLFMSCFSIGPKPLTPSPLRL